MFYIVFTNSARQEIETLDCVVHMSYMVFFAEGILHITYNDFEHKNSENPPEGQFR